MRKRRNQFISKRSQFEVAERMRPQAYGSGQALWYESLAHACPVRYLRQYASEGAARRAIHSEKGRGFLWMQEFSEKGVPVGPVTVAFKTAGQKGTGQTN